MSPRFKIAAFLVLFAFAFDFKGETGGSLIQLAYCLIAALGGVLLLIQIDWQFVPPRLRSVFLIISGITAYGILVSFVFRVDPSQSLRVALPFVLISLGMLLCMAAAGKETEWRWLLRMAFISGILSSIWSVYFAIGLQDWEVDSVRYRLLSPALPLVFAISISSLWSGTKWRVFHLAILGTLAVESLISQTRGLLLMYVSALALLMLVSLWLAVGTKVQNSKVASLMGRLLILGAICYGGFLVAIAFNPDIMSEWVDRIEAYKSTSTGMDPTYLTRVAEISGIMDTMKGHNISYLTGLGFGSPYTWDSAYSSILAPFMKLDPFYYDNWLPSHNTWVYLFFTTGAIGSVLFLYASYLIVSEILEGFKMLKAHRIATVPALVWFGPIALISFASQSLTGNAAGTRGGGVYIGFSIGMVYVGMQYARLLSFRSKTNLNQVPLGAVGETNGARSG